MPYAALTERRRRHRSDEDVRGLAREWTGRWVAGGSIEAWLRRHVPEMTLLIRDQDWSWQDLADALNEAGIIYASGQAWTADRLCNKAGRARAQLKARADRAQFKIAQPGTASVDTERQRSTFVLPAAPAFDPDDFEPSEAPEPEFKFATLRGWTTPKPADPPADQTDPRGSKNEPEAQPEIDVDAVLREFLARPRYGSIPMPQPLEPEDD